jgi:NTP-dependent ternary system trypsin peptidase co-occuring protein
VDQIGLRETIEALRDELSAAMESGREAEIQFPVGEVQLEVNVGVTRTAEAKGGVRFWVIELGGGGSHATEALQKITVTLEPPVDRTGAPVKVARSLDRKP